MRAVVSEESGYLDNAQAAQLELYHALQYFLYGSLTGLSPRSYLGQKRSLTPESLLRVSGAFRKLGILSHRLSFSSTQKKIPLHRFSEALAYAYCQWDAFLPTGAAFRQLSSGQPYEGWMQSGGHERKYGPVHLLQRLLLKEGAAFFKRAMVHGSIATLDDVPGFSDMDLAFVVRTSALKSPKNLLRLRRLASQILTLTHAFDPFMHHGPFYLAEMDFRRYPEALFPSVLFGYGADLAGLSEALWLCASPSEGVTDRLLDDLQALFERWPSDPLVLRDGHELECILGCTLILPALYLQRRTGTFRYKRETFSLAERDFSSEVWEPIRTASRLRRQLGPRPKPSQQLVATARWLQWPGLLTRQLLRCPSSCQRAQEAANVLGPDYPGRVLRLLEAMRRNILSPSGRISVGTDGVPHSTKPSLGRAGSAFHYFDDIPQSSLEDLPPEACMADYEKITERVISVWAELPQPPLAIYQVGAVKTPGISDLDFIVVFPGGRSVDPAPFEPTAFPDWAQKHLTHLPYFCPESAWIHLPAWYPTFRLRHLWGSVLPEPKVPERLVSGCALGMLVDYLLVKIPFDFLYYARIRPLRVRTLLASLHSLKYTVLLAQQARLEVPPSAHQAVAEGDALRESWFSLKREQQLEGLASLSRSCCQTAGELIVLVDQAIQRNAAPWSFPETMRMVFEHCEQSGELIWVSPPSFLRVLGVYASECPKFAAYLAASGCRVEREWEGGAWNEGLRYHARSMMAYGDEAARLGVPAQKYIALGYSPQRVSRQTFLERARGVLSKDLVPGQAKRFLVVRLDQVGNVLLASENVDVF